MLKKLFITGLIAILPLTITVLIIVFLVNKMAGFIFYLSHFIPILKDLSAPFVTLIGLVVVFLGITFIGLITKSVIGKVLFDAIEKILTHVPIIRTIYTSTAQFTTSIFGGKRNFEEVVLVEFPRKDSWSLGFITGTKKWIMDGEEYVNVFIPTTPNPTSGYYIIVKEKDIVKTHYSVEWGIKIIMSAGMILPSDIKIANNQIEEV